MSSNQTDEQLIKNEQIIRDKNLTASQSIKNYFRGQKEVKEAPLAFVCECSQIDCKEQIHTSIETYEKLHRRADHFTVHKGHDTPAVEKVVAKHKYFDVVEKPQLSK